MRKIIASQGMGKTTELIKSSAENGYYIVCHQKHECQRISKQAERMGLNIPFPITFSEFVDKDYHSPGIKGFLIDNVDMLIEYISLVPVAAITMRSEGIESANQVVSPVKFN